MSPQSSFFFDRSAILVLAVGLGLSVLSIFTLLITKTFILSLAILIAFALFVIGRLRKGSIILPPMIVIGAVWFLVLVNVCAALVNSIPFPKLFFGNSFGLDSLGMVLIGAIALTVSALATRKESLINRMLYGGSIAFAVLILSQIFLTLLSWSGVDVTSFLGGSRTLVGRVSEFAVLLGSGVIGAMVVLSRIPFSKKKKIFFQTVLVLGLVFLAGSNSSLVWILVGIVSLGLFLQGFRGKGMMMQEEDETGVVALMGSTRSINTNTEATSVGEGEHKKDILIPAVVFILSIVFVLGHSTFGSVISNFLRLSEIEVIPTWSSTLDVARSVYAENLFFGVGHSEFSSAWQSHLPEGVEESIFWNTPFSFGVGLIPSFFITTGLLGGIAWILLIASVFFVGVRAVMQRGRENGLTFSSVLLFMLSVYFLAVYMFAVVAPSVFVLGFIILGLFISSLRFGASRSQEWGLFFSRSPRFGFLVVFLLALSLFGSVFWGYSTGQRYIASSLMEQAAALYQNNKFDEGDVLLSRAVAYHENDVAYRLASIVNLTRMQMIASDTTLTAETAQARFQQALTASIGAAVKATTLDSKNPTNWITLARVYEAVVPLNIEGSYDNAVKALDTAIALNPRNPSYLLERAQLEISQKNVTAGREFIDKALLIKQNYTDAIFLKSQLEVQQGNTAEALKNAEAAAYFEPDNQTVLFQLALLRAATRDFAGAKLALARILELNSSFANAHYIMAVLYANEKNYTKALAEVETIIGLSPENATQLATVKEALLKNQNPFPENVLALPKPLEETTPSTTEDLTK